MREMREVLTDRCFGAALLLAHIEARVALLEARGEKPLAAWEDGRECVRGIIAAAIADASRPDGALPVKAVAELMDRLCVIARDCGVSEPQSFF